MVNPDQLWRNPQSFTNTHNPLHYSNPVYKYLLQQELEFRMILSAILIYVSLWFCAIFGAIKDGISDRAVYRYNDEHMRIEYEPWHGVGWLARDFPILLMFLAIFLVLNITDFIMIGLILSIHIYLMILLHEYFYSKSANEIAKVNMNQLYRYIGKIIKKVSML